MSDFLRDLAIAKFPRFGIVYNVKVLDEPELTTNKWGKSNVKLKLAFYSLEAPPQHLQDRVVTLPLWKAGELLDLLEQGNDHLEKLPVIAIELHKRNDTDEYGTLRLRLDLQPALDAFTGEPVEDVDAPSVPLKHTEGEELADSHPGPSPSTPCSVHAIMKCPKCHPEEWS